MFKKDADSKSRKMRSNQYFSCKMDRLTRFTLGLGKNELVLELVLELDCFSSLKLIYESSCESEKKSSIKQKIQHYRIC